MNDRVDAFVGFTNHGGTEATEKTKNIAEKRPPVSPVAQAVGACGFARSVYVQNTMPYSLFLRGLRASVVHEVGLSENG